MRWETLQKRLEAVQERRRDRERETRRRMQAVDRHKQARERREVRARRKITQYVCSAVSMRVDTFVPTVNPCRLPLDVWCQALLKQLTVDGARRQVRERGEPRNEKSVHHRQLPGTDEQPPEDRGSQGRSEVMRDVRGSWEEPSRALKATKVRSFHGGCNLSDCQRGVLGSVPQATRACGW